MQLPSIGLRTICVLLVVISILVCPSFYFGYVHNFELPSNLILTSIEEEKIAYNPLCITEGRWVHWSNFNANKSSEEFKKMMDEERKYDDHLNEFRIKRGIHSKLWRDDLKCGFKKLVLHSVDIYI